MLRVLKYSINLGFSFSLKKRFAIVEPKQRNLTLGVWQGVARKALCVCKTFPSAIAWKCEEVGADMPITFGRHQLPLSDRMGQVLLL